MNRRDVFTGVIAAAMAPTELIEPRPVIYGRSLSLTLSEISRIEQPAMARVTLSMFCDQVWREVAIGMAVPYELLTKHYDGDAPP